MVTQKGFPTISSKTYHVESMLKETIYNLTDVELELERRRKKRKKRDYLDWERTRKRLRK